MAVQIRLARYGTKKFPYYRIVVADQRRARDGKYVERLGTFQPAFGRDIVDINLDRLQYWTAHGAQTSPTVARIVKRHVKKVAK